MAWLVVGAEVDAFDLGQHSPRNRLLMQRNEHGLVLGDFQRSFFERQAFRIVLLLRRLRNKLVDLGIGPA